jgi:hypothetical protein
LQFDSPLHDAAESQTSPLHFAAGSQISSLHDAAGSQVNDFCRNLTAASCMHFRNTGTEVVTAFWEHKLVIEFQELTLSRYSTNTNTTVVKLQLSLS